MLIFGFQEFKQDMTKVFNTALKNEVVVNDNNGNSYKLLPIESDTKNGKSPFEDIPSIKLNITMDEIVEIFRESRAGI